MSLEAQTRTNVAKITVQTELKKKCSETALKLAATRVNLLFAESVDCWINNPIELVPLKIKQKKKKRKKLIHWRRTVGCRAQSGDSVQTVISGWWMFTCNDRKSTLWARLLADRDLTWPLSANQQLSPINQCCNAITYYPLPFDSLYHQNPK